MFYYGIPFPRPTPSYVLKGGLAAGFCCPVWVLKCEPFACLSRTHFVFFFGLLALSFLFLVPAPSPLDIWPSPQYDIVLTAIGKNKRKHLEKERLVQRRVGWEGAEERFWAGLLLKTGCHLLPKVICDGGTTAFSQLQFIRTFHRGLLSPSALLYSYSHTDVSSLSRLSAVLGELSIKKINSSLYSTHHKARWLTSNRIIENAHWTNRVGNVRWFPVRGLYLTKSPPSVKGNQRCMWTCCWELPGEEGSDPGDVPTTSPWEVIQPQEAVDNKFRKWMRYDYKWIPILMYIYLFVASNNNFHNKS